MVRDDMQQDFDTLVPGTGSGSRRTALQLMLGAGYAAAAAPVLAQAAIRTPAEGLVAGTVHIEAQGFQVPAYRAAPAGRTGLPVVLVVQEIFGVHDYIADVCRRLAHAGYLAIAPELYARHGDPRQYTETARLMSELVAKVPDAQVLSDLDATVRWAGANGGNLDKVGITGFCWGGRIAWLYAAHGPVKAGVAWYGRLVGTSGSLTPKHPIDVAAQLKAPVLGLYGGADSGIPQETVEQMKAALAKGSAAAQGSQFVVYPDAPHAFHADYRPSFRKEAAEDGWRRLLDWFKRHGVA
nr:dienelactone hydrolase family protein [Pulveribacter sp.]